MADPRRRAVLAAALLLLTGCGGAADGGTGAPVEVVAGDRDGLHGTVLTQPFQVPTGSLTDSRGEPFELATRLEAPVTLVFFGYTRCPDICQVVMANVASALSRLEPEEADQVALWFVTTDPSRDDPATLRAYLDRFDASFEGLTGPLPRIVEVAGDLHVAVERGRRLPSGGYEVLHSTPVLGILPDGSVPLLWNETTSAAQLAADLDRVLTDGVPTVEG